MPGVYGEMLVAFPELFSRYEVFSMDPLPGGGFSPRTIQQTVRGYAQRVLSGDMGDPDAMIEQNDKASFYVMSGKLLTAVKQGWYIEIEGDLFKFVHEDHYEKEGGFHVYKLQLVSGPTDREVTDPRVDDGILNGY